MEQAGKLRILTRVKLDLLDAHFFGLLFLFLLTILQRIQCLRIFFLNVLLLRSLSARDSGKLGALPFEFFATIDYQANLILVL